MLHKWLKYGPCILILTLFTSSQQARTVSLSPPEPNQNFHMQLFIYSPNKHIFSHLEPILHTHQNDTQRLVAVNKTKKTPRCCCTLYFCNPETPCMLLTPSWRHVSPSGTSLCPRSSIALFPFWVVTPCCCLWKGLPPLATCQNRAQIKLPQIKHATAIYGCVFSLNSSEILELIKPEHLNWSKKKHLTKSAPFPD